MPIVHSQALRHAQQRTQGRDGGLVPSCTLSVLHAHLPAVRLVRRDGIVARHLAVMRVEAPLRPRHLQAGRHHRAIDVDRQPALTALPDGASRDGRIHPLQPRQTMGTVVRRRQRRRQLAPEQRDRSSAWSRTHPRRP